jgi:hypothetical protein
MPRFLTSSRRVGGPGPSVREVLARSPSSGVFDSSAAVAEYLLFFFLTRTLIFQMNGYYLLGWSLCSFFVRLIYGPNKAFIRSFHWFFPVRLTLFSADDIYANHSFVSLSLFLYMFFLVSTYPSSFSFLFSPFFRSLRHIRRLLRPLPLYSDNLSIVDNVGVFVEDYTRMDRVLNFYRSHTIFSTADRAARPVLSRRNSI